jgi:hypothetical protein
VARMTTVAATILIGLFLASFGIGLPPSTFSLRPFKFTSNRSPGGTPPCLFLRKVFKTLDLMVDFDDKALSSKELKLMHSLGEISKYACSDDVVCQVSCPSILAELERGIPSALVLCGGWILDSS